MIKITAAELIIYAMKDRKITVSKLAADYGCATSSIVGWRGGSFCPRYNDLYAILEFMGFDLAELTTKLRLIRSIEKMRFIK